MNDQNQNINPVSPQVTPTVPVDLGTILSNIKPFLSKLPAKFYSNKKIFWPVSIAFGLIFLVLILGLLFGKRGAVVGTSKSPSPSPTVQVTPQASASGNILIDSQNKLNDLKTQIDNLDIKESRLSPPSINFDIRF